MSDYTYFDEEEFNTNFNGKTIKRIAAQARPYKTWVIGFVLLIALVSIQDAIFTFISKLIIDEGIIPGDTERLTQLVTIYGGMIIIQAAAVFGFIYLAGILGERIRYDLRGQMFNHLQTLSLSYYSKISFTVRRLKSRRFSGTIVTPRSTR
ncbi:MAG: ABC transporter transmembrane domain-containing protein [Chloroflexota bacterium]